MRQLVHLFRALANATLWTALAWLLVVPAEAQPAPADAQPATVEAQPASFQPQPTAAPPTSAPGASRRRARSATRRPTVVDSTVGYIDNAIPGDQFRFRYEAAYDNTQPTRDEFFWAVSQPKGPGVPQPETRLDYQTFSAHLEKTVGDRSSAFVEVPIRLVNPQVNENAGGLSDVNAGFKTALKADENGLTSFQFRTYAPTGNAHLGLGTRHVSLEPALLTFRKLGNRGLRFEAEFRDWIPVGGTDGFAGNVIRYGAGFSYFQAYRTPSLAFTPVCEIVGWTALGGKSARVLAPGGIAFVESAAGDTIVNAKFGLRISGNSLSDVYLGYGRALTGDTWYKNVFRIEFRRRF